MTAAAPNVLVIGYGSIGQRHCRILTGLGIKPAVVSRHLGDQGEAGYFTSTKQAFEQTGPFDLVIIASASAEHHRDLDLLAGLGHKAAVLVEKPLVSDSTLLKDWPFSALYVGYNLRFHPVLQKIHSLLAGRNVLTCQVYIGSYLPDWRPGSDFKNHYSCDLAQGGGALNDLSHEIDYINWLLGDWSELTARGGNLNSLGITADEAWSVQLKTTTCALVSLQLNYLDRNHVRRLNIVCEDISIEADLVASTLKVNGELETFSIDRDHSYQAQLEAILDHQNAPLCHREDGAKVVQTIEAIRTAAQTNNWIIK